MKDGKRQLLVSLINYCRLRGVDTQSICRMLSIDIDKIKTQKDYVISDAALEKLINVLCYSTKDNLLGLHLGEFMQSAALGVVGQVIPLSRTVGDAFQNCCKFVKYITNLYSITISKKSNRYRVEFIVNPHKAKMFPNVAEQLGDFLMAFAVHELNGLLYRNTAPYAISILNITSREEISRIFGTDHIIVSSERYLEYTADEWAVQLNTHNIELQNILISYLQNQSFGTTEDYSSKVYEFIIHNSFINNVSIDFVASNFNMTPRTLQRKLKSEHSSFMTCLEKAKKEISINYLTRANLPLKEISYVLGYKNQSAFFKAFKAWTGVSPKQFKLHTRFIGHPQSMASHN